ncbi:hypothetical protein [Aureispira anguillae]|uniref:Uncharacterized protein n=1 Tax=Aureispira anguillae TaxID=2864201 RepID=A0A915YBW8_9BACT|nr:hypothetical protein [Aureispira anguillae]BDS10245.1 hypothetical protein AsAng_0009530 [Aureispira anguillae]
MAEDVKVAIDHVVKILADALTKRKEEGIELERTSRNFWSKVKKRITEDTANKMESNPEDTATQESLKTDLEEMMKTQNGKMGVVVFLYNQGIEL